MGLTPVSKFSLKISLTVVFFLCGQEVVSKHRTCYGGMVNVVNWRMDSVLLPPVLRLCKMNKKNSDVLPTGIYKVDATRLQQYGLNVVSSQRLPGLSLAASRAFSVGAGFPFEWTLLPPGIQGVLVYAGGEHQLRLDVDHGYLISYEYIANEFSRAQLVTLQNACNSPSLDPADIFRCLTSNFRNCIICGSIDELMNHSKEPNFEEAESFDYVGQNQFGGYTFRGRMRALRHVDPGEELTCDYRDFLSDAEVPSSWQ